MFVYTKQETQDIIRVLNLLEEKGLPRHPEIFDAWCGACITVPIELAVLQVNGYTGYPEVLMIHRKDKFFHGWHIPGSIMLPGETEEVVFSRLARKEVFGKISTPQFVDRMHTKTLRGQEAALLFTCYLDGQQSGIGKFFQLQNPPEDTLEHHKVLLKKVTHWWYKTQR